MPLSGAAALFARERLSCGELSPDRGQNEGLENGVGRKLDQVVCCGGTAQPGLSIGGLGEQGSVT